MMLVPLSFVVLVSMIKDIFEDLKRHQSDNQENNRKVLVADPEQGVFKEVIWRNLHVGMIVKIFADQFFPADLVLLNSSAPQGIAYIETKNLDGETNLKHKQGTKELVEYITGQSSSSDESDGNKNPKQSIKMSDGMSEADREAMKS